MKRDIEKTLAGEAWDEYGNKFQMVYLSEWNKNKLVKENYVYIADKEFHFFFSNYERLLEMLIDLPMNYKVKQFKITA